MVIFDFGRFSYLILVDSSSEGVSSNLAGPSADFPPVSQPACGAVVPVKRCATGDLPPVVVEPVTKRAKLDSGVNIVTDGMLFARLIFSL